MRRFGWWRGHDRHRGWAFQPRDEAFLEGCEPPGPSEGRWYGRPCISLRYPLIEALTGLGFGLAVYDFSSSLALVSALVLIAVLAALASIDVEHRLRSAVVGPAAVFEHRGVGGWRTLPVVGIAGFGRPG